MPFSVSFLLAVLLALAAFVGNSQSISVHRVAGVGDDGGQSDQQPLKTTSGLQQPAGPTSTATTVTTLTLEADANANVLGPAERSGVGVKRPDPTRPQPPPAHWPTLSEIISDMNIKDVVADSESSVDSSSSNVHTTMTKKNKGKRGRMRKNAYHDLATSASPFEAPKGTLVGKSDGSSTDFSVVNKGRRAESNKGKVRKKSGRRRRKKATTSPPPGGGGGANPTKLSTPSSSNRMASTVIDVAELGITDYGWNEDNIKFDFMTGRGN